MPGFEEWESFYLVVGAAAGALIGLQFVVMTLIAERPVKGARQASAAFSSPTVVHFSMALFLSAVLRVPWHTMTPFAVVWGATGLGGALYTANVIRRARLQTAYRPDLEDWISHVLLPFVGYAALVAASAVAASHPAQALFAVAGAVLLILFIAIHNAWDAVSYHVLVTMQRERGEPR